MKKILLCMMLFCGLAMISTSCQKDDNVPSEVENGTMAVDSKNVNINTAQAVEFGNQNAILFTAKEMTADNNEGIAIVFNGDIATGTYDLSASRGEQPKVVGLKDFNMGELPFVIGADTVYYGEVYVWISGKLSITEENGTYTVILSQCVAASTGGSNINLSLNYTGVLQPYVFDTDNKFVIDGIESPIGLAGLTSISGMSSLGLNVKSMLFMSANRKRFFIVSFLGNENIDGEYQLGYLITPYLPILPCVHVALDHDFWTMQPQTGYVAKEGTMKIVTNPDGSKTVTMKNLKLKNLEHDNEFFFPVIDAELTYHGMMFEIGR
ncbi:MAG: hypothetical protein IKM95_04080 [Bacteroidales bacterium]|nr:hypothetical protein [Bacteroidales bacterium]